MYLNLDTLSSCCSFKCVAFVAIKETDEDIALYVTYYYKILVRNNGIRPVQATLFIQLKIVEAFDSFDLAVKYFLEQLFLFGLIWSPSHILILFDLVCLSTFNKLDHPIIFDYIHDF